MMLCRSLDQVLAAADADSAGVPPLSQELADLTAVILAPSRLRWAEREPQAA